MTFALERADRFREWIASDRVFIDTGRGLSYAAHPTTTGTIGALLGHLNAVCGGDEARRLFLKFCFLVDTSRDLHVRDRNALLAWLAPRHFEMGDKIPADYEWPDLDRDLDKGFWLVRAKCRDTAALVVAAARARLGQLEIQWTVTEKVTQ